MNNEHNEKFTYNYSAATQNERMEIEDIKRRYEKSDGEDKIKKIRELDSRVKNTPSLVSIPIGVIGILIFGLGLTTVLEWKQMLTGIGIMTLGTIVMVAAYPVYAIISKRLKNKYRNEILRLSDEFLNNSDEQ